MLKSTGSEIYPDENYAREIMQLFTIVTRREDHSRSLLFSAASEPTSPAVLKVAHPVMTSIPVSSSCPSKEDVGSTGSRAGPSRTPACPPFQDFV